MAGDKRTVEFRLRAIDEASAEFDKLKKSFSALAQSQEETADELARVNPEYAKLRGLAGQLAGELTALKDVFLDVKKAARLSESLQAANEELAKQAAALAEVTKRQQEAAAAAKKAGDAVEAQTAKIAGLKKEIKALEASEKQLSDNANIVQEFERISAEIAQFEQRQKEARVEVDRLTHALLQQKQAAAVAGPAGASAARTKEIAETTAAIKKLQAELDSTGKSKGIEQRLASLYGDLDKLSEKARKAGLSATDLLKPFDQLQVELAQIRQRLVESGAPLERYAGELKYLERVAREASAALKESDVDLTRQAAAYERASAGVAKLRASLDPLEQELKQAGVATDRLADEQERLDAALKSTAGAAKTAAQAQNKVAQSAASAAAAQKRGLELQRTSLSIYQRLRGQVLGLTAAYVGLYGVVSQVTQAFQAGSKQRGIENTFTAVNNGDLQATNEELEYSRKLADYLGQDYLTLASSYAKFRASVGDKLPLEEQKFLFESIAESATVLRLSVEDTEGVFTALNQMFSKGTINAEELRQQLGDRMPGAVKLLADGMGITEKELMKLMEQGRLSAENMLLFAEKARTKFGPGLAAALKSPQAQFRRLLNIVTDLRVAFEKAAEKAGLGDALRGVADALADPKVKQGVESLARAFVGIVETLPVLIRNLDVLVGLFKVLAAGFIAARLIKIFSGFKEGGGIIVSLTTKYKALVAVLKTPIGALGAAGVLFTLYNVLQDLVETSPGVRKVFVNLGMALVRSWQMVSHAALVALSHLGEGIAKLPARVKFAFLQMAENARNIFWRILRAADEMFVDLVNTFIKGAAKLARALGKGELADKVESNLLKYDQVLQNLVINSDAKITALEAEKQAELTRLAEQGNKVRAELTAKEIENQKYAAEVQKRLAAEGASAVAGDTFNSTTGPKPKKKILDGDGNGKAEKELNDLLEKVREKMNDIAAEVARGTSYTLAGVFAEIEADYAKLTEDIKKLSTAIGADGKPLIAEGTASEWMKLIDRITEMRKETAVGEGLDMRAGSRQSELDARRGELDAMLGSGAINLKQYEDSLASIEGELLPGIRQTWLEIRDIAMSELAKAELREEKDLTEIANAKAKLALANQNIAATEKQVEYLIKAEQVNQDIAGGLTDVAFAFGDVIAAGGSLGDAFKAAGDAFRSFAAEFLRDIARMIIKQMIFNALGGKSGPLGMFMQGLGGTVAHSGGVIGNGSSNRTRAVSPTWFSNAQRFHSGGLPGLRADEVPAILQRGEEVLSKSDPRNILNGGGGQGGATMQRPQDIQVINTFDAEDVVSKGLGTPSGTRAILNIVRSNRTAFSAVLNGG